MIKNAVFHFPSCTNCAGSLRNETLASILKKNSVFYMRSMEVS